MRITRDRDFYKTMISIAMPIGIQNLITFTVSMADTIMLGSLGEIQLSASSIGNNLFFILMVLMFGLGGGSSIMSAQYYGKKDMKSIHKIISIMYRFCIAITLVFVVIAILIPREFISIFTTDQGVIEEGIKYLRVVAIGYVFYSLTNCTITVLRSVQTVKISMVVYSISLVVNIFFNWVFIFGNLGFEPMGVQGAAIATVIARITEFLVVVGFMLFFEKKIHLKLKHLLYIDTLMLKDYIKNCTPVLFNELFWGLGSSMISVIVGRMGTEVVAANSINNVANQFVTVFIFGLGSASSVIIGNIIGEGNYDKAREYASTITILSFIMGIMSGLLIYLIRPYVVDFYNISQETKAIAMEIMTATAIISVFQSMAINTMMGVLRGGGDNRFVLINDVIFMWIIAIPFGFIGAFLWDLPIFVVFLIIKSDEVLKVIASVIRIFSGKWVTDLTRNFGDVEMVE
ncbi:MAG: MATE family efflux transporter [Romboutsia sp.]|uniref:MATE family efflux transporter n=1 Tax=Romboutsia sp. TaxID=1965302 RepID=UPI003F351673